MITGSKRIPEFQVIEDEYIYFYHFEHETFTPVLSNVMINFMRCGMIILGERERYSISFKQSQCDFNLFARKYNHDLMVCANNINFENCIGLTDDDLDFFIVAKEGQLIMFNDQTYQEIYRV